MRGVPANSWTCFKTSNQLNRWDYLAWRMGEGALETAVSACQTPSGRNEQERCLWQGEEPRPSHPSHQRLEYALFSPQCSGRPRDCWSPRLTRLAETLPGPGDPDSAQRPPKPKVIPRGSSLPPPKRVDKLRCFVFLMETHPSDLSLRPFLSLPPTPPP